MFEKSAKLKINLTNDQRRQLSSIEKIKNGCMQDNVIAYDIYNEGELVGFVMARQYSREGWFLWNYAIDKNYQGQGIGYRALVELLKLIKEKFKASLISTTYIYGNEAARKLYEKVGFVETDVVEELGCHEVNMLLKL
ncbi:GNAT family N-acetyltransferase [Facklamia sp. 7083-14-GEN3]|uniref:GNAT family N-acetyltransferase n=1 Tax=Facklamia sp. 7083-14-GEN3 TaxID=2973478 RepID=UPI00215BA66D|nr:GNAT family N-acetyltransferase [Facklamia sp. 7083-14-GEN3]MCR8968439.1 GNAT family N-acetyltransferase [Facklamia sp. 7083-14-GEN3]